MRLALRAIRQTPWHPQDGKPVTLWPDRDEAFLQVAKEVRKAAEKLRSKHSSVNPQTDRVDLTAPQQVVPNGPRSSNLRLAKTFTQLDKDRFQLDTFEYIARYFENSLKELQARNPGFEGVFRRVDANRFSASIYKDGQDVARATVFVGGQMGTGIYYSQGASFSGSSYNEMLTVQADDQSLYLTSLGMTFRRGHDQKLSQEGAAELLWEAVIAPLQR